MKRVFILVVVLAALLATAALGEGNRLLELADSNYIENLLYDGEALYITCDYKVSVWRPGDDQAEVWDCEPLYISEENGYYSGVALFAGDGVLEALRLTSDEDNAPIELELCDVAFGDDGTARAENVRTLELPDALRNADYIYLRSACVDGEGLAVLLEGESGVQLVRLAPEAPTDASPVDLPDWEYALLPSPEGALLLDRYYEDGGSMLLRISTDSDPEPLCPLPESAYAAAVDPNTGAIYTSAQGKVFPVEVPSGEPGQAFGSIPLEARCMVALNDGRCAVAMNGAVAVLDTNAVLAEDSVLKIREDYSMSSDWVNRATLQYAIEHPEAQPVTAWIGETVLEDMLTQSPDVDVYIMDAVSGGIYDALLDRGYLLPLDASSAISELTGRMYPGIQDRVCRDGAPVALPLRLTGSGMGIGAAPLEKLGLKLEDVPRDWSGFLDFLEQEIKPRLNELEEGDFTYEVTAGGFARVLRQHILTDFVYASDAAGQLPNYEDERLQNLLERVDQMDFTEYGLPEASEEYGDYGFSYDNREYLISLELNYAFEDTSWTHGVPLLLGFGDDLPGVLPVNMTVAFVNPFSTRTEAATAFLEALAARLPEQTLYGLCPDLNEPLRDSEAEAVLVQMQQAIDQSRAAMENAEPIDRQLLEQDLAYMEEERDLYNAGDAWLISQETLTQYRTNADRLYVARPTWFDSDSTGEAYDLFSQYEEGLISLDEFLSEVNRKARMQALEG